MDEIKINVANNIARYRKKLNMTQLQLAEKLNYSDKAVSKWERAEALPDIYVMHELAVMFGITLDELIGAAPIKSEPEKPKLTMKPEITLNVVRFTTLWRSSLCVSSSRPTIVSSPSSVLISIRF